MPYAWLALTCSVVAFILFLTAVSVLQSAAVGHYPDGTVKFGLYIFVDQSWAIYLTLGHLVATVRNAFHASDGA